MGILSTVLPCVTLGKPHSPLLGRCPVLSSAEAGSRWSVFCSVILNSASVTKFLWTFSSSEYNFFLLFLQSFSSARTFFFLLFLSTGSPCLTKCCLSVVDYIVGTVHKAKGLEFDTVHILDDFVKVPCARHNLGQLPHFRVGKETKSLLGWSYSSCQELSGCFLLIVWILVEWCKLIVGSLENKNQNKQKPERLPSPNVWFLIL